MTELEMETRIKEKYSGAELAVIDMNGSGSNFEVRVASSTFPELSRVERHQAIMSIFDKEIKSGEVHALSIKFF